MVEFRIEWQYGGYSGISHIQIGDTPDSDAKESTLWWLDGQSFWIFEGNGACDCNRGSWLCGESFDWETGQALIDFESSSQCGDEIIFHNVEFYRDGVYIGRGHDKEWYELEG